MDKALFQQIACGLAGVPLPVKPEWASGGFSAQGLLPTSLDR